MTPLISVVMATYNGEQFIDEAIQSVLDQSFENFEFIIVDDGSTDRTAQHIASFNDDRIIYLKKSNNSGIADSLNIGISKAKGKYIARMDDDDVCLPDRFKVQLDILERNIEIIFCGSCVLNNDSETLLSPEKHDSLVLQLLFRNPIFHPTAMIRKDVLLKHKYRCDAVPSEDYDLWSRLIFEGKFYHIQRPLLYCRVHDRSITMNRRKEQLLKNVSIAKFMFSRHGFTNLTNNEENITIFTSFNYSVSGKQIRGLINWFRELKQSNAANKRFPIKKFNTLAETNLKLYLTSFFTNKRVVKKLIPFLYLPVHYKIFILKFYTYKLVFKSKV